MQGNVLYVINCGLPQLSYQYQGKLFTVLIVELLSLMAVSLTKVDTQCRERNRGCAFEAFCAQNRSSFILFLLPCIETLRKRIWEDSWLVSIKRQIDIEIVSFFTFIILELHTSGLLGVRYFQKMNSCLLYGKISNHSCQCFDKVIITNC